MSEAFEHEMICSYLKANYPDVIFISDASGLRLPIAQATRWSRLKSHRGIPDLIILEPRRASHGLCIELKRTGEKVVKKDGTPKNPHIAEQLQILDKLYEKGYAITMAIGFENARDIINEYLGDGPASP